MPAYFVANVDVKEAEGYEEYRKRAPETIERYGGRYLARAGRTEVLEGDWAPKRLVILEFESFEQAKRWYKSEEYAAVVGIRHRLAESQLVLVEGVEPLAG